MSITSSQKKTNLYDIGTRSMKFTFQRTYFVVRRRQKIKTIASRNALYHHQHQLIIQTTQCTRTEETKANKNNTITNYATNG